MFSLAWLLWRPPLFPVYLLFSIQFEEALQKKKWENQGEQRRKKLSSWINWLIDLPSVFGIWVPEELELQTEIREKIIIIIIFNSSHLTNYEIRLENCGHNFNLELDLIKWIHYQDPKAVEATGFWVKTFSDQNAAFCPVQTAALVFLRVLPYKRHAIDWEYILPTHYQHMRRVTHF